MLHITSFNESSKEMLYSKSGKICFVLQRVRPRKATLAEILTVHRYETCVSDSLQPLSPKHEILKRLQHISIYILIGEFCCASRLSLTRS